MTYNLVGTNSPFSIRSERNKEFQIRCASSGERIFKRANNDARGIYFDPYIERRISSRPDIFNSKYLEDAQNIGLNSLRKGYLLFYETKYFSPDSNYVRFDLPAHKPFAIDQLASQYSVTTKFHQIPARFDITGLTVTIKDLRDDTILATSTFFIEKQRGRSCGGKQGEFSTSDFMTEVLGLTRKYSAE